MMPLIRVILGTTPQTVRGAEEVDSKIYNNPNKGNNNSGG